MGLAELDRLLTAHQAIIDAWYAEWFAKMKARNNAVWARRRAQSEDASRKKGE